MFSYILKYRLLIRYKPKFKEYNEYQIDELLNAIKFVIYHVNMFDKFYRYCTTDYNFYRIDFVNDNNIPITILINHNFIRLCNTESNRHVYCRKYVLEFKYDRINNIDDIKYILNIKIN